MDIRPPVPPFTAETARQKVQAPSAWNTCDPERVALAYTIDSEWRNRDVFLTGREAIVELLRLKWARELEYRLRKELWCFTDNRISVRFEYESHDSDGQWWRSHGNEHWSRRSRAHAPPRRQHQRLQDRRTRAPDPHGALKPHAGTISRRVDSSGDYLTSRSGHIVFAPTPCIRRTRRPLHECLGIDDSASPPLRAATSRASDGLCSM